jgi:hypothetical protein
MPNPHKVKIKNHKVTKNLHPVTHLRESVVFEPEQPEILEIWFDDGSPFPQHHLGPGGIGDSLTGQVDKFVMVRTHYPYRTSPLPLDIKTGPEIIVDPGGRRVARKRRKGATKKSSRKGKSTAKKVRKRSVKKGKKRAGKKR